MTHPEPDEYCGICNGSGVDFDYVPYGNGNVRREYDCECLEREGEDDE